MTTTYKTPYDIRVVEFHLRNGTVSHADYAKHLTDLPNDDQEWEETDSHFSSSYESRNYSTSTEAAETTEER